MKFFRSSKADVEPDSEKDSNDEGGGLLARLAKTRRSLSGGLLGLFGGGTRIDESLFDELQDSLLLADIGVSASTKIINRLRQDARDKRYNEADQLIGSLRHALVDILADCETPLAMEAESGPFVVMMVGVNGVGKTTTLAKLASGLKQQDRKVMLAACDTFRAAAIEQLQTWGQRLDVPVIAQSHGADAAAVAFDAYSAAVARGVDALLIDTAGRQHTHGDLMEQLKKLKRVLQKAHPDAPHEILMTVDAGNGQNVISQAEHFHQAVGLSGLCVTKLDGTAKGGVIVALAERFGIPIRFIGVGEGVQDLRPFVADEFVHALLPGPPGKSS